MGAMALRQFPAASARSASLICTCTSFSASANVATETSGPTGGAVPNAGGAPGVADVGSWELRFGATAAASEPIAAVSKNCRRAFDIHPPGPYAQGTSRQN